MLLFFVSSWGYVFLFRKKAKIELYFVPIFVISALSLFLFAGGLFGALKQSAYIALALGLLCFCYMVFQLAVKKLSFQSPLEYEPCGIILLLGTLIFTLLVLNLRLLHYDNFSHWAVIVKYLLSADSFPQPDTKIVVFLDYPPGTAVFIYYVCRFLGNSQGVMLAAQNLMVFSCFYCIFGIVREKRRFLLYSFLGMGCAVLSYLNLTIRINNLLVDFLLPLLSLASISCTSRYSGRPIPTSVYNFFLLGFTSTVKGTGIVFSSIAFLYYLFSIFRRGGRKSPAEKNHRYTGKIKRLLLVILTGFGMVFPYALWEYRMNTVFSDYVSKFDIDANQLGGENMAPVRELHSQITEDFIRASLDLTTRAAQVFLLCNILALIAIIFVRLKRKRKWKLGRLLIIADIMVVLYYAGILYMYLYSMPEEEAVNLAGFDRYACSIMVLFVGILISGTVINMENSFSVSIEERGAYKAYSSPSAKRLYQYGVLLTLVLGVNFIYSEINGLISIREGYWDTLPGKTERIAGDLWTEGGKENTARYLVAASDKDGQVFSGEVRYVCRYFLYSPNVEVTENLSASSLKADLDKYDYILVLDSSAVNLEGGGGKLSFMEEPGLYKTSDIAVLL